MKWNETKPNEMKRNETKRYGLKWNEMTWNERKWNEIKSLQGSLTPGFQPDLYYKFVFDFTYKKFFFYKLKQRIRRNGSQTLIFNWWKIIVIHLIGILFSFYLINLTRIFLTL